jgi:hypothetical protein
MALVVLNGHNEYNKKTDNQIPVVQTITPYESPKQVITKIERPYHENWKQIENPKLLLYIDATFQFKSDIIITELEGCLIKKISDKKLYDKFNINDIKLYDTQLIKVLTKECSHGNKSLIILSNQISNNKLLLDGIKQKFEAFLDMSRIPVFAIFALECNRYMKPHTGMWKILNGYYAKFAEGRKILNYIVIGNEGGQITQTKAGPIVKCTDTDRAFAWNINCYFYTVFEYLHQDMDEEAHIWSRAVLWPDTRKLYAEELRKQHNSKIIFEELAKLKTSDEYVIVILGPPRCGKTKLANNLVATWNKSLLSKNHAIIHLTDKNKILKQFIKTLTNRISVILELKNGSIKARSEYIDYCRKNSIPILYIIINIGVMSLVLNHVSVETAKKENVLLIPHRRYAEYKSTFQRPSNNQTDLERYVVYSPIIEPSDEVLVFRY